MTIDSHYWDVRAVEAEAKLCECCTKQGRHAQEMVVMCYHQIAQRYRTMEAIEEARRKRLADV